MVEIAPLKGLVYNLKKIKDISRALAPPYDIISEAQRRILEKQDSYNIVHLTLPRESTGKTKYENSGMMLKRWIDDGALVYEKNRCFYMFEEEFIENEEKKHFTGFIGLLKVEEYAAGKVLRHEMTLPKPKEDRLNLLKATRSNLEFIYTLYNDADKKIADMLDDFLKNPPLLSTPVIYDSSLFFRIWKIDEEEILNKIVQSMKNKSLLIADGHHRYETSRMYKETLDKKLKNEDPENYILALFVSSTQKDILIHPTHRLVRFSEPAKPEDILKRLKGYFYVEKMNEVSEEKIENKMKETIGDRYKRFCLYFGPNDCFSITLKDSLENIYEEKGSEIAMFDGDFEYLDVNILHRLILQLLLNQFGIDDIKFVHTITEVIGGIDETNESDNRKGSDVGFILNSPSISTVEKLSYEGKIMPQKSTYFYPKPCSGLVIYKFCHD